MYMLEETIHKVINEGETIKQRMLVNMKTSKHDLNKFKIVNLNSFKKAIRTTPIRLEC